MKTLIHPGPVAGVHVIREREEFGIERLVGHQQRVGGELVIEGQGGAVGNAFGN
jgi:hypothetical protein